MGDRYRIGTAVFEVTQPRVTCYRVGMRLGEPRLPALLVSHGRPGFYLRVIDEGDVQAGQEIVKVADGPERMTVAEIDALLYRPPHPADRLERALRVDALSPGWQASFRALLDQARGEGGGAVGNADSARCRSPVRRGSASGPCASNASSTRRRTSAPSGSPLPTGHRCPPRARASTSPCAPRGRTRRRGRCGPTPLRAARRPRLPDQREAGGARAGQYLAAHRRPGGDDLQAAAPRGAFVLQDLREDPRPVVLVSAGVGVTLLLAMLYALADDASRRQVWWLHATRNGRTHAFAGEIRGLLSRIPDARLRVFYSRPGPEDHLDAGTTSGWLTADAVAELGLPTTPRRTCADRTSSCGARSPAAPRRRPAPHTHGDLRATPAPHRHRGQERPGPHSLPSSGPGPAWSSRAAR